ncbi:MAG: ABC transporter permease [Nitriliruptor sp.]|nr:MAG: ABC transporter permease [Nitriliruptor sp.]TVR20988.1 MAG: ABC transporter permease [Nitriliruptor sp.]
MTPPDHPRPDTGLPAPQRPDLPDDPRGRWPHLRRVGTRLPLREYLRELWRRREFAITVPLGELRAQNQDSALGQIWHLLNPLLLIAVYYLIFGVLLQVEERRGVDNYLPFLIVGVIVFNFTRSSIQTGARMIVKNRKLVQSINFPRAILPLSAIVSEAIAHLYALPVMLVLVMLVQGGPPPQWTWLLLIVVFVFQTMFNLGISMVVARLSFHFRDVQQLLPFALRLYFYSSGVLIPINIDIIPNPTVVAILQLNPAYLLVEMAREAVLVGPLDPQVWLRGALWSVAMLVGGFWYFRAAENEYGRV